MMSYIITKFFGRALIDSDVLTFIYAIRKFKVFLVCKDIDLVYSYIKENLQIKQ